MAVCVFGSVGVDLLSVVASYPREDQKVRCLCSEVSVILIFCVSLLIEEHRFKAEGMLEMFAVSLKRLGDEVQVKLVSKIGKDLYGQEVENDFLTEKIDSTDLVRDPSDTTPFTYVIVNQSNSTRTCIHHPLTRQLTQEDFRISWLIAASGDLVKLLFLDSRHPKAASKAADEANARNIPILLDLEKIRPGMEDLLTKCTLLNTSSNFPSSYTKEQKLLSGIFEILRLHKQINWCVTTLGKRGCILVQNICQDDQFETPVNNSNEEENFILELEHSSVLMSEEKGIPIPAKGFFCHHRVYFCTASKIEQVVDTTGCGDAFIGGLLYSLVNSWPLDQSLSYATTVAGIKVTEVGARKALPSSQHEKLQQVLHHYND